jgi:uncharacterized protein YegL
MIDYENQKLRQDMMFLLGQIEAIRYPIMWQSGKTNINQAYYDLLDSIREQYVKILKKTIGYEDE